MLYHSIIRPQTDLCIYIPTEILCVDILVIAFLPSSAEAIKFLQGLVEDIGLPYEIVEVKQLFNDGTFKCTTCRLYTDVYEWLRTSVV